MVKTSNHQYTQSQKERVPQLATNRKITFTIARDEVVVLPVPSVGPQKANIEILQFPSDLNGIQPAPDSHTSCAK